MMRSGLREAENKIAPKGRNLATEKQTAKQAAVTSMYVQLYAAIESTNPYLKTFHDVF